MGKLNNVRRELEHCQRGCKYVHSEDKHHDMALNGMARNDEPPRTLKCKEVRIQKLMENAESIRESKTLKNKEMKNKPTSHCQSMIMLSLSVRLEKRIENNLWRISRAPLQGTPSTLIAWLIFAVKLFS